MSESFVYILRHASRELVKIGKADDVEFRIGSIGRELVDTQRSMKFAFKSGDAADAVERLLHRHFSGRRVSIEGGGDGSTEWFDASVLPEATNMLSSPKPICDKAVGPKAGGAGAKVVHPVKDPLQSVTIAHEILGVSGKLYSDMWVVGIELGLKVSELSIITMDEVRHGEVLISSKGRFARRIVLEEVALRVLSSRARENPAHKYAFQSVSNRAKGASGDRAVNRSGFSRAISAAGDGVGLEFSIGTESMRKTREYMNLVGQKIDWSSYE